MINILLSDTRMTVVKQKKKGKGAFMKYIGSAMLPQQETPDYLAIAKQAKALLKKKRVGGSKISIILEDHVVFKEFTHQPVSRKAVDGFARLEARTVLRETAGSYAVAAMTYGNLKNEAGEVTGMLLAAPVQTLKGLRVAFSAAGFLVDSIHSTFDCYTATLQKVLPVLTPEITGAAIDFGYDHTLISLFSGGELVSQRRLNGVIANLVPAVVAEYGCTEQVAYTKLSDAKVFASYAQQAKNALTGFTYDVLRTLRVLASPLRIQPQQFVLSGAITHDATFVEIVKESLGLPCLVAGEAQEMIAPFFGASLEMGDLFVLAGPAYSPTDLLQDLRQQRTGSLVNATTCAVVTVVAVLGMLVLPALQIIKQQTINVTQQRYNSLKPVEDKLGELAAARGKVTGIEKKMLLLDRYRSNTGETMPKALALFTEQFTLETISYNHETGAYEANFMAQTKEDFFALKDAIYANEAYYLNLTMSIMRETEEGAYQCRLYFEPADFTPLPQAGAAAPVDGIPVDGSGEALLEELQG